MAALDFLARRIHPAVYVAVGVLAFVAFLLWTAPAALVVSLSPRVGPLALERPSGTLWHGRAELAPVGQLQWELNPLPLVWMRADVDWILEGHGVLVAGNVSTGGGELNVRHVRGQLSPSALNAVLAPYRMSMEGDVRLADIEARISGTRVDQAAGHVAWKGGQVSYVLGGKSFTVAMPGLGGDLRAQDGAPTLDVSLAASHEHVMQITLNAKGWAELKMTKRFLEVAGFPWQGKQPPETYVLVVSEQVF